MDGRSGPRRGSTRGRSGKPRLGRATLAAATLALLVGCSAALPNLSASPSATVGSSSSATVSSSPSAAPSSGPTATAAPSEVATPGSTPTITPIPTPRPAAGSLAEAGPYCALIDPVLIEDILGQPIGESRVERSFSGGASCTFATGDIDQEPGLTITVNFDRTSNLARMMPGPPWDAQAEFAARRAGLGGAQDIANLGVAATGDAHELHVLLSPDVLVWMFGDQTNFDAWVALAQAIETRLAATVPPDTNPPYACRLMGYEAIQAILGRFVERVTESSEFDPATTCWFTGTFAGGVLPDIASISLFRTDDIRTWLMSDRSIGYVDEAIRRQATTYTAQQWLADLGLNGQTDHGDFIGPAGSPVDVDGACNAYWSTGDETEGIPPRFEAAFGADDYLVLQLSQSDGLDVARQLAAVALQRLTAERGGTLSACL